MKNMKCEFIMIFFKLGKYMLSFDNGYHIDIYMQDDMFAH